MSKYKITVIIDEPMLSFKDIYATQHIQDTLQWAEYKVDSINMEEIPREAIGFSL